MSVTRKNSSARKARKKRITPMIVVTNTILPAEQTLFPEKLKMAQEILSKTKFLPR